MLRIYVYQQLQSREDDVLNKIQRLLFIYKREGGGGNISYWK